MNRSNTFRVSVLGAALALSAAVSAPVSAAGPESLRNVLDEYQKVQLDLTPDQYRSWIERLDRAIAAEPGAPPGAVYAARGIQASLCSVLSAWEDALRYADEAARVAPWPEGRFSALCDAALAAEQAWGLGTPESYRSEAGERLLQRYTALQELVEGTGGLLARSQNVEGWGPKYLMAIGERARILDSRGAREEAKKLTEKALKLLSERRIPLDTAFDRIIRQGFLLTAAVYAAQDRDRALAERYLIQLSELPGRSGGTMLWHLEQVAEAEREWGGEEAYQARLSWWLRRVGPSDPSWAPVLYNLALNQSLRIETRPAAAESFERLLAAYEKNPPPAGVGWPNMQTRCWLNLADLYSEDSAGLRNMPRARELAQRYLDATKDDKSAAVQRNRAKMEELLRPAEPGAPR